MHLIDAIYTMNLFIIYKLYTNRIQRIQFNVVLRHMANPPVPHRYQLRESQLGSVFLRLCNLEAINNQKNMQEAKLTNHFRIQKSN